MKVKDDKELYNEIESQRDALILDAARKYNEIKKRRDNDYYIINCSHSL